MKKYLVRDGETEYEVTEVKEKPKDEDVIEEEVVETKTEDDESTLSAEEIAALKSLAAAAPKLLAMAKGNETTDEDEDDKGLVTCDEDEDETDIDVDCDDEEIEKKPETKPARDSKRSFGAIERKPKVRADDSLVDEVSDAWAKRYGGK